MDEILSEIEIPLVIMSSIAHLGIHSPVESSDELNTKTEVNGQSTANNNDDNSVPPPATRSLRKRSASEDSLIHKTRNRKIQRPQKRVVSLTTDTEIKNFYININKKVKLKPNLLETIFEGSEEDDSSQQSVIDSEKVKNSISSKKFKRLLTLHDGLNATKALKDKRKSLIKRHLGARKRPKKISKDSFMEYFKKLKQDDEQHNNDVN